MHVHELSISPCISRKPTTQPICTLAAVGSASHMSPGAPAAEMSAKEMAGKSEVTEVHGSGACNWTGSGDEHAVVDTTLPHTSMHMHTYCM